MKIAWHSICYTNLRNDPEQVFRDAKEAGYDGVELMQAFDDLGGVDSLAQLCQKYDMRTPCCWGDGPGDVRQRVREGVKLGMLFVPFGGTPDEVAAFVEYCKPFKITPVLHPHIGSTGQGSGEVETYADCKNYLDARPGLMLCPDTAHLTVAGSDPAQVVLDMGKRVSYLHLKDWRPTYGKGPAYGRGFCELGRGMVNLRGVLMAIHEIRYDGWLCVEQDVSSIPLGSARESRELLRDWGL